MKYQMLVTITEFQQFSMRLGPQRSLWHEDDGFALESALGLQKQHETSNAYTIVKIQMMHRAECIVKRNNKNSVRK